jgi:tetratricopeptide (TPR) repeat protein
MIYRTLLGPAFVVIVVLASAHPAAANELDDFQQARMAYESQNYGKAAELFEALIGGDVPKLRNRPLLLESRKYLAASYLFLGLRDDAEKEMERLLLEEPTYELDPLGFPAEVQKLFSEVNQRLETLRREEELRRRQMEEEARIRDEKKLQDRRKKSLELLEMAETDRIERINSRWIAMIPFGVGQFQNGHTGLGTFFAISESLMAALNITSFFLHQHLEGQMPADDELGEARFAEKSFRITNQVTLGAFAILALGGIVDAQVRFKPSWSKKRHRKLPDDLRDAIKLSSNGAKIGLAVRF